MSGLDALERLRRSAPADRAPEPARCDLCLDPLDGRHGHLVDVTERSLRCACQPCVLLFEHPGAGGGRYRAVPDRWVAVRGFGGAEALGLPVGAVFVFISSETGQPAAFYPGPAGATESMLPLGAWEDLAGTHPELAGMALDVEAALMVGPPPECFVVPVDACYRLVGLLRRTWRGFDGGDEARRAIDGFLAEVRDRARA